MRDGESLCQEMTFKVTFESQMYVCTCACYAGCRMQNTVTCLALRLSKTNSSNLFFSWRHVEYWLHDTHHVNTKLQIKNWSLHLEDISIREKKRTAVFHSEQTWLLHSFSGCSPHWVCKVLELQWILRYPQLTVRTPQSERDSIPL